MTKYGRYVRRILVDVEMVVIAIAAWSPIHVVRIVVLRAVGAKVGAGATFYHGFQVRNATGLRVGERTSIGDGSILDARGGLVIGDDVNISTRVQVWSAQHDWQAASFDYVESPVEIGQRAWLGPNVVVLPGARIGEGSVIGAGAVVAGDIPPFSLAVGVPAKVIRSRNPELTYRLPSSRRKSFMW